MEQRTKVTLCACTTDVFPADHHTAQVFNYHITIVTLTLGATEWGETAADSIVGLRRGVQSVGAPRQQTYNIRAIVTPIANSICWRAC